MLTGTAGNQGRKKEMIRPIEAAMPSFDALFMGIGQKRGLL
jgi:hypothetical protein